ncbi:MAG TPA: RNA polymerase factor sigma-32 [Stellaceae bacterium]|jgi:RNA polymerase sigma-32 factor|nr:RNA polymerase factor sigma-32 [Stellaceae bacterium]
MTAAKPSYEPSLARYLAQINRFPMLDEAEEAALARRYRETGDEAAARRLVTSHLRLVAKLALGYRGYGLPLADLISEGAIGMLKALKRFDPDRGIRLASYAKWWIRAQIQEYVLRSSSLVKIGTTAAEKKLFFNLRKLKARLGELDGTNISPESTARIAAALGVREADVMQMNARLSAADDSLNAAFDDGNGEWQDALADESENQEAALARRDEADDRRGLLNLALAHLHPREREIIRARYLTEKAVPLEVLAGRYGVTPQRIRQIELAAVEQLQSTVRRLVAGRSRSATTQRAA